MKVLAIVQAWNSNDSVRGFTVRWMEKLSERVEELIVLTLEQREPPKKPNIQVFSLGKESTPRPGRKWRYILRWHSRMRHILSHYGPDVIFTHMTPIYSVLAAPYTRPRRIPVITWFAHRKVTGTLKLAHCLSDRVLSINESSYPYRKDKFLQLGHGIDTDLFSPACTEIEDPPLLLSVGRLSPIKDLMTLIEAVLLLRQQGYDVRCVFVGDAPERDRSYAEHVNNEVERLGLGKAVQFAGAMPLEQVVKRYRQCLVHLNCSPTGALDKAALEAMACGKLSVVSNEGFDETLGKWKDQLLFQHGNAGDLTQKLKVLL